MVSPGHPTNTLVSPRLAQFEWFPFVLVSLLVLFMPPKYFIISMQGYEDDDSLWLSSYDLRHFVDDDAQLCKNYHKYQTLHLVPPTLT